jgi:hypothetical protein
VGENGGGERWGAGGWSGVLEGGGDCAQLFQQIVPQRHRQAPDHLHRLPTNPQLNAHPQNQIAHNPLHTILQHLTPNPRPPIRPNLALLFRIAQTEKLEGLEDRLVGGVE